MALSTFFRNTCSAPIEFVFAIGLIPRKVTTHTLGCLKQSRRHTNSLLLIVRGFLCHKMKPTKNASQSLHSRPERHHETHVRELQGRLSSIYRSHLKMILFLERG